MWAAKLALVLKMSPSHIQRHIRYHEIIRLGSQKALMIYPDPISTPRPSLRQPDSLSQHPESWKQCKCYYGSLALYILTQSSKLRARSSRQFYERATVAHIEVPHLFLNRLDCLLTKSRHSVELNDWHSSLPRSLALNMHTLPHTMMLHLAFWWCIILLHRPSYKMNPSPNSIARKVTWMFFLFRNGI